MFGAELCTEQDDFVGTRYIPRRELELQCDLVEIENDDKDEKKTKDSSSDIFIVTAGTSHALFVKETKLLSYGGNSLGACGHNHVSEIHRPTEIVSCVIPEDTTDFHKADEAYRLDMGKIFSGIQ